MQIIPRTTSLHTGRLVLAPADPLQAVDQATIIAALHRLGLLGGQRSDAAASAFAAGPALGALIGFTGCAVQFGGEGRAAIDVGPWLRIPPPSEAPRLFWGRNTRPPRCPACGAPLRSWRERLPVAAAGDVAPASSAPASCDPTSCNAVQPLRCDACETTSPALRWRWGRHGGAARSTVSIEEVFPGEGTPLPALVKALDALGAGPWVFFYIQD
ncbi:MAG: hypothetical protein GVY09_13665 [Gammaproteobacteria bacterium]|jgi:hypothetical protein|nr:hypothetical protein [Gammaproteobacteria bacterium]